MWTCVLGSPESPAEGRTRVRGVGLGTCVGDGEWPCVSPWVSSGRARAALRRGEQVRLRQAEQRSWVCSWKRVLSVVKPQGREDGQASRGERE